MVSVWTLSRRKYIINSRCVKKISFSTEVTIEFYENLHSIADSDEVIIDFANFCEKVHDQIECEREDCELNLLVV